MSTELHEEAKSNKTEHENLPKYCDYHTFFLVEELALEDYRLLHYGNCSLIGKLGRDKGNIELENIRLHNLPRKYSLPEGTLSIRLLRSQGGDNIPATGRFCEVRGEVVLLNVLHEATQIPLTSRHVQEQLLILQHEPHRQKFLDDLLKTHKPAVRLWYINEIDRAGELAERNLEIRMLSSR